MSLPPGLSEKDFANALEEFSQAVGKEWVFTNEDHINTYRDPYSILRNDPDEPIASAAVAPTSVEKVQAVVKVANKYKIPLWVISSGKNFGYGGPETRVNGSVILDLKRMNKVIEINEKHAYALLEPGASQYDVWREIQRRGLKLWIDGPAPAYSSLVANTIERGSGYGAAAIRVEQICGMEVVLPDGELIRTGTGANSNSETWQQFKYSLGPWLDGMFTQSNFGIVTKIGIWLLPEAPAMRTCSIISPKYDDIVPYVDKLRELRIGNTITNAVNFGPNMSFADGHPEELMKGSRPGWKAGTSFTGNEKAIDANWEQVQDEFSSIIPGMKYESKKLTAPYDYTNWVYKEKQRAGIPSFQGTTTWDHYMSFVLLAVPFDGEECLKYINVMEGVARKHNRPYRLMGISNTNPRSLVASTVIFINPSKPDDNKASVAYIRDCIEVAGQHGYVKTRAPTFCMDQAMDAYDFNNNALRRFNERIKDALDPNGVLAPGKNGIWPERLRGERTV